MPVVPKDDDRENRISMEIIVDSYNEEERVMGWYCYLEEQLDFPFRAKCVTKRSISPLKIGDEVDVIRMGPEEECEHEIFVIMRWDREDGLAVPLSQLEVVHSDEQTRQAIEDWHYWVGRGYQF